MGKREHYRNLARVRENLEPLRNADKPRIVAALTKGFVPSPTGPKLILETIESALPEVYKDCTVYVAGPSHAEEVAMGKITGLVQAVPVHTP